MVLRLAIPTELQKVLYLSSVKKKFRLSYNIAKTTIIAVPQISDLRVVMTKTLFWSGQVIIKCNQLIFNVLSKDLFLKLLHAYPPLPGICSYGLVTPIKAGQ